MTPGQAPQTLETLAELEKLLREVHRVAIVGLSDKPGRDSHAIAAYLKANGYEIVGVNPALKEVLGEPCHPSLTSIPGDERRRIDLVLVFRRSSTVPAVIDEAAALGLGPVWLQPGTSSRQARERAAAGGVSLVDDLCIRTVHASLLSGRG